MSFSAQIFIPETPASTITWYDKVRWYAIGIFFASNLIWIGLQEMGFTVPTEIPMAVFILCLFGYLYGKIDTHTEFEKPNGRFNGEKLEITAEGIVVSETVYPFSKMADFNIEIKNYYGQPTGYRGGPYYFQGVSNEMWFNSESSQHKFRFKLNSAAHIEALHLELIDVICHEKIAYQRKYLNFIPRTYNQLPEFRDFVILLLEQKRLDCTEGLLILGYSSDSEAKVMRQKYCR